MKQQAGWRVGWFDSDTAMGRLVRADDGLTTVEYGVMLALISLVATGIIATLSTHIVALYESFDDRMATV